MHAPFYSARFHIFLFCAALLGGDLLPGATSVAQDKPDRPPWAQKSKAASAEKNETAEAPAEAPAEVDDSQQSTPQRGRIRVNVNLVNEIGRASCRERV